MASLLTAEYLAQALAPSFAAAPLWPLPLVEQEVTPMPATATKERHHANLRHFNQVCRMDKIIAD